MSRSDAEIKEVVELQKMRLDYAWKYFDLHAKQRTTLFNFYIVLMPFLFGGVFFNLKIEAGQSHPLRAALVAIMSLVLSVVFALFDIRNKQLIRVSEENLKLLESQYLYKAGSEPLLNAQGSEFRGPALHEADLYGQACKVFKHSFLIGFIYWGAAFIFFVLAFHSICIFANWHPRLR